LLGKALGALKDETTPGYVYDFDTTFIVSGIRASFPLIYQLLSRIPFSGLQKFLNAENRIYAVSMISLVDPEIVSIFLSPDNSTASKPTTPISTDTAGTPNAKTSSPKSCV